MNEVKWILISVAIALIIGIVTLLLTIESNDPKLVLKQVSIILYLLLLIITERELYKIDKNKQYYEEY